MKTVKTKLFFAVIASLAILSGCQKNYEIPTISAPSSQNVEVGKSTDISFSFTADAGFGKSSVSATGGTATIKTDGTAEATSGTIVVAFTAGSTVGAGSVTLTVTDAESQAASNTAVLALFEKGAPMVTTPANSSTILVNSVDVTFPFTAEGGYKSSTLVATNGTAAIKTDAAANATSGNIVVTFTAGTDAGAGSVAITVADNNNKVGTATAVVDVKKGISVTENISANTTWETGKIYILETRVAVLSGVTLTIEPGVIVKGNAGIGSNATALLIARGATLMAEGTETSPIIFTSVTDNILPGQVISPNLPPDLDGLWGGLVILGNAPIAASASPKQIEGIPPSDANGLYGGTDPTDNSGVIKYVSIRHGGANIGEGNEINGLTLGGVGNLTVIENVEIIANQDDGIEWFGGTVNVKNAVVWNAGDDAIDTDQGWGGTLDNFIVITPFDKCFELDGPEGSSAPAAKHTIKNGHVRAGNAAGLVDIDDAGDSKDSYLDFMNIYFYKLKSSSPYQTFDAVPKFYAFDFNNFEVVLPGTATLQDIFLKGSDAYATAVTEGANTVGANPAVFTETWSWAAAAAAF